MQLDDVAFALKFALNGEEVEDMVALENCDQLSQSHFEFTLNAQAAGEYLFWRVFFVQRAII
jgi:hypothetical protein